MSITIDQAFVSQFSDNVTLVSQQRPSRLEPYCTLKTGIVGEAAAIERAGRRSPQIKADRNGPTPIGNQVHDRRWLTATTWEDGDLLDKDDEVRMLINPTSTWVQSMTWGLERQKDQVIINAALGTALTGHVIGSTNVALPSGQKIVHGGAAYSLTKVLTAVEYLNAIEMPNEGRVSVINSKSLTAVLSDTTITSYLFNEFRLLQTAEIHDFLGMHWLRSELLPTGSAGGTQVYRKNIVFHPMYLSFGIFSPLQSQIGPDPSYRFGTRIYMWEVIGAVRMQEEAVVEIQSQEHA
jgi:hypothetical protein